MSSPADWNVHDHITWHEVAPALGDGTDDGVWTGVCRCGWRSKATTDPRAAKRATAAHRRAAEQRGHVAFERRAS
ncbi:hypothetical protein [Xylanimonas ulmi]|uniref:Uncharacterized protein n=1 Tax=Xylanimonas ulmi TaxID=228973 RepID=A0A4Q7M1F5_9MICO|nr:hypothetical protein [Xylanibacterium ulmi]RZS61666.1 hypothetical protein EV386_1976 [Xylanibacterium ulmi]